jgi:hypothetical protein
MDLPRPKQAETLAMPSNQGLGFHDHWADFQSPHTLRSHTQIIRSARVTFSRLGAERRKHLVAAVRRGFPNVAEPRSCTSR